MKKSRTSLFRTLILSLVLLVTLFIIGVAWFATKEEATASGLSIRSSYGLGLDSSFDDANYATKISRTLTNNFQFPLISSNGVTFFKPKLDRATGNPVDTYDKIVPDGQGGWASKGEVVPTYYPKKNGNTYQPYKPGDYYVEDIWFRSEKKLDVYLTDRSKVSPADVTKRKSDVGEFSRDYIAGAARIGFFNVTKNEDGTENEVPLFTWVPNDSYHLNMADNFAPIHSTGSTSSGGTFNPNDANDTFGLSDTSKFEQATDLFAWEVNFDKTQTPVKVTPTKHVMFKDKNDNNGNYYVALTILSTSQVDHGFLITSNNSASLPNESFLPGKTSKTLTQLDIQNFNNTARWIGAYFEDNTYVYGQLANGTDRQLQKLTVDTDTGKDEFFTQNDRFQILIAYNPDSNGLVTPKDSRFVSKGGNLQVIGFVFYDDDNNVTTDGKYIYNGGAGIMPDEGGTLEYYSMKNGETVVITNDTNGSTEGVYGLNAVSVVTSELPLDMVQKKDDKGKDYLSPVKPMLSQMFKVITTDQKTYKLKSLYNSKYLAINNGKIVLEDDDTNATFSLVTVKGGPMMQFRDGYYISFANGKFIVSNSTENAKLKLYMGTGYSFTENSVDKDTNFKFYNPNTQSLEALSNAITDSALSTKAQLVVTLQEVERSYKAHIRIKIWAEGTDREAKVPLSGGIFKTHLEFQGVTSGAEAPTNPPTVAPAA